MTEGNFSSKHDGFPPIETMLQQDEVDELEDNLASDLITADVIDEALEDQGITATAEKFSD